MLTLKINANDLKINLKYAFKNLQMTSIASVLILKKNNVLQLPTYIDLEEKFDNMLGYPLNSYEATADVHNSSLQRSSQMNRHEADGGWSTFRGGRDGSGDVFSASAFSNVDSEISQSGSRGLRFKTSAGSGHFSDSGIFSADVSANSNGGAANNFLRPVVMANINRQHVSRPDHPMPALSIRPSAFPGSGILKQGPFKFAVTTEQNFGGRQQNSSAAASMMTESEDHDDSQSQGGNHEEYATSASPLMPGWSPAAAAGGMARENQTPSGSSVGPLLAAQGADRPPTGKKRDESLESWI